MNIKILPPFFHSDILSHSLKPCMKTKPSIFLLITITLEFVCVCVSLKAGKQAKGACWTPIHGVANSQTQLSKWKVVLSFFMQYGGIYNASQFTTYFHI